MSHGQVAGRLAAIGQATRISSALEAFEHVLAAFPELSRARHQAPEELGE
jgi:hypothetical protein